MPPLRYQPPHPPDSRRDAYVLIITIMAVALMTVAAVSLLALARTDLRSSDSKTGRLRAEIVADAALSDAIALLREHTRHGNYITATAPLADTSGLPADAPHILTEIYRPTSFPGEDPTEKYLVPDDANFPVTGDYLFSLSSGEFSAEPDIPGDDSAVLVQSRPWPKDDVTGSLTSAPDDDGDGRGDSLATFLGESVPPGAGEVTATSLLHPAGNRITIPTLTEDNSYNFNQRIALGNADSYLVQPPARDGETAPNALGQWVYTRDSSGQLNGRFAYFIEDESTKSNPDASGVLTRSDDIVAPSADPQYTEPDPTAALKPSSDKASARTALDAAGTHGDRIPTTRSVTLIDPSWEDAYPDAAGFLTNSSKSDLTTARGWRRMDINSVVADNPPADAARIISDWIRDAWTGPIALTALQTHQLYSDERLRLQVAANIVDYIDPDSTPTGCGDIGGYPVIGIEDVPYIVTFCPYIKVTAHSPTEATWEIRLRFNAFNMTGRDLDLADEFAKLEFTGLPAVYQTGGRLVMDEEDTIFTVEIPGDLDLTGTDGCATDTAVPQATDAEATGRYGYAGVKTFTTKALKTVTASHEGNFIPTWQANQIIAEIYGPTGDRVDSIEIVTNDKRAEWKSGKSGNTGDLVDSDAVGHIGGLAALTESIVFADGNERVVDFGDPRYRGTLLNDRWRNWNNAYESFLSQTSTSATSTNGIIDFADQNSRAYAFDWFRYYGDHPKMFHRNAPLLSVGELGNISACEYPWRTLYFQYPERFASTTYDAVKPQVELRRSSAVDFALADLFKVTPADSASGLVNINSQKSTFDPIPPSQSSLYAGNVERGALASLFQSEPLYKTEPTIREFPPVPDKNLFRLSDRASLEFATVLSNRRRDLFASSDAAASSFPWFKVAYPSDYNQNPRPFYQVGEAASPLGRALAYGPPNSSGDSFSNPRAGYGWNATCTKIDYSALGADEASGDYSGVPGRTNKSNALVDEALERDHQVEAVFRAISSSTTTRGNVFRILYVGQSGKDYDGNGKFSQNEVAAEFMGEAFVERSPIYQTPPAATPSNEQRTTDSHYHIRRNRPVFD